MRPSNANKRRPTMTDDDRAEPQVRTTMRTRTRSTGDPGETTPATATCIWHQDRRLLHPQPPQSLALWRVDAEGQDFVGQPFRVVGQVHLQIEADEAGGEGLTAGAGVR